MQGGAIRQLTDRKGPDNNPQVSNDGKLIAYTGYDQNDNTYNVTRLYVMNADGTNRRVLTPTFDRTPSNVFWAEENGGLYFTAEDRGSQNLWFVPVTGGAPRQITNERQILNLTSIAYAPRTRGVVLVGTRSTSQSPADVYALGLVRDKDTRGYRVNASGGVRLTDVNRDLLEGAKARRGGGGLVRLGRDGRAADARPPTLRPRSRRLRTARRRACRVGSSSRPTSTRRRSTRCCSTSTAGRTRCTASASTSSSRTTPPKATSCSTRTRAARPATGRAFGNAINNAYPGQDYDDLMRGVDEVVKRGYIDERNLFVAGGSGGGVLTTWIVGHNDRFAAAVAMKPVVNWYSFVGTTDSADWYYNFKRLPWEDPEEHMRRSPITYVGNVKTPTMILTGDIDLRTPLEQTEQYYRALKLRRVPTAMVRLADEYHGFNADFSLRHPSNRVAQILFLRAWFDKYKRK